MNLKKILGIAIIALLILGIRSACSSEPIEKTAYEIEAEKIIEAEKAREKKIDYALTELKMRVQKKMKDPDSFETIAREWDRKDKGDTVKLLLKFRGNNSFGGKAVSTVLANYYFNIDQLEITDQFNN